MSRFVSSNVRTTLTYNERGNVTQVFNQDGERLVLNEYDQFGQITSTTDANDQKTWYEYDANGNQRFSWTISADASGARYQRITRTDYDANDRVIGTAQIVLPVTDADDEDGQTNLAAYAFPEGSVQWTTSTHYNLLGQVDRETDRQDNVTEHVYDLRGLEIQTRTQSRDEDGTTVWLITRTAYDAAGRAVLTTSSFVESAAVTAANDAAFNGTYQVYSPQSFDNATTAWATYSIYDLAGRVRKTLQLKNVVVAVVGSAPNYTTQIRVGADAYDPETGATPETFFSTHAALVSSTQTWYDGQGRVEKTADPYGTETRYLYNARAYQIQTAVQSRNQDDQLVWLVSRSVYDSRGRVQYSLDQVVASTPDQVVLTGLGTHTVYDELGRVQRTDRLANLSIQLSGGETTVTSLGTLISRTQTVYNEKGQVTRTVAADGQTTDFEYDSLGRQTATLGQIVPATSVALPDEVRSAIANLQSARVRLRTETAYDPQGRVKTQTTNIVEVVDAQGNVLQTLRQKAATTQYVYDQFGNQVKTVYTDGSFTTTAYDKFGRMTAETEQALAGTTEADLLTKTYEYDALGRLTAVILPAVEEPVTHATVHPRYEYRYDAFGNQVSIRDNVAVDAQGLVQYDHDGVVGDDTRVTRFTYDEQGRETSRTLPIGVSTTGTDEDFVEHKFYDAYGRLHYEVSFEGVVTAYVYDDRPGASGRLSEKRFFADLGAYSGGAGSPDEVVQYTYDAFGRQANVLQDADGDTTATKDDQRVTKNEYDAAGRLITVVSTEGETVVGVIHYGYDAVTGLHKRTWTAPNTATAAESATTDTYYFYDTLGRLDEVRQTRRNGQAVDADPNTPGNQPEATDYVYDLLGNLKQTRLPNKVVSEYTYDDLNRLTLLREFKDGQNSQQQYVYEDLVDTLLAQFNYDLAPDGKRKGATENQRFDDNADGVLESHLTKTAWTYDALGRLTSELYDTYGAGDTLDYIARYRFDLAGNRREKATAHVANPSDPAVVSDAALAAFLNGVAPPEGTTPITADETVSYEYDANDRLLTEAKDVAGTANDTTTLYEYGPNADPANGDGGDWSQQTAKTVYDSSHSPLATDHYSYNLQGRMASAEVSEYDGETLTEHTKSEYTYDDDGIRVSQTVRTDGNLDGDFEDAEDTVEVTKYLNDGENPTGYSQVLEEKQDLDHDGALAASEVVKSYTLGLDVIAQQAPAIASGGNLFLLYDGHGSTRGLVDAAGQPLSGQVFRYDAFGNRLDSNTALTSLLYSGEQTDGTGLQYLRARYYDPAAGRFNRLDPFFGNRNDPQSLHKYLYVHGNPIEGIDPSGRMMGTLGSVSFQAALLSARYGAMVGGILGAVRGVGDAWLDDNSSASDVAWAGVWGATKGAIFGGVFGFLGPYLGGLHWAIQLTATGGLSAWGIVSGYKAYCDALAAGDNDLARWRAGWVLVDGVMGVFGMAGIANVQFGNQKSNFLGGTKLPDLSSNTIAAYQYAAIKWLLAKAHVTLTRQPKEGTRPYWVKNPNDVGDFNPNGPYGKEIWLREDATWYVLMHEVFHVVYAVVKGPSYVPRAPQNEPAVLNLLKTFFWGMMNSAEQKHAGDYAAGK